MRISITAQEAEAMQVATVDAARSGGLQNADAGHRQVQRAVHSARAIGDVGQHSEIQRFLAHDASDSPVAHRPLNASWSGADSTDSKIKLTLIA